MNKLKRRILAGTAAAAMLLWNFADLPQGALGSAVLSAKAAVVSAPVLTGTAKTEEPSMTPFEKDTFIKTLWKNFTVYESETVEKYNSGSLVISNHSYEIRWYKGENGEPFIPYPVTTIRTENGVTYVDNYEVVSIRNAFAGNNKIKKLMLPASVEKISDEDFKDCENLTSVSFDRRSLIINEDNEAESKYYIKNPALSSIGTNAFKGCNKLESFEFEVLSNLRSIGLSAFSGCEALKSVEFDYDNTGIVLSRDAFSECKALKRVVFPKSIDHISENCFRYCTALETVDFGKVKAINNQAFRDCTSLKLNALPEDIEELKYGVFYNCPKAEFTELPSTLKKIEPSVFSGSGIKGSITIPAGTEFEPMAFVNCPNLKYLEIEDMTGGFVSLNGIVYRKFSDDNFTVAVCPQGIDSIYAGNIPAILGAKHIEPFAFSGTVLNTPVIDGKYIKKIDSSAFEGAKIKKLTITNSSDDGVPIELSSCVFKGAEIDELVIDTDITSYYDGAGEIFKNAHIGTVTITDKVTKIPDGLFGYNSSSTFRDDEEIAAGYPTIDKLIFNASKVTDGVSPGTFPGVVSAEFGDNITEIPGRMFDTPIGSSKLTSVTIPEGVRIINWGAFYGCEGLTEIELPDSLEYISGEAFRGTNIKSVYVPGNVTHISMFAFLDMPRLKWVALPNGLKNTFLGDFGIGFKSTGSNMSDIAPSDNKVIVYGDSIAENYVTKYKGNDEFVAVPDLTFVSYRFEGEATTKDMLSAFNWTGEPLTPILSEVNDTITPAQAAKYKLTYGNNIDLGVCDVTVSTRDPLSGVGIGDTAFIIFDGDCRENGHHLWYDWEVSPTDCTVETRICGGCYKEETRALPNAVHTWDMENPLKGSKFPNCTSGGRLHIKCSVCGKETYGNVPATGHTWKVKANGEYLFHTELPDFGKDGYTCRKCKDCGAEDEHFNIVPGYTLVPENVQITDITSDGATVTFDTFNGELVDLIIEEAETSKSVDSEWVFPDEPRFTTKKLNAGTAYKLTMTVWDSHGNVSPEYYTAKFVTPLPAIENLTISEDDIKATSVKLSWDTPVGVDSVDVFGLLGDAPVDNLAELSEKVGDSTLLSRIHPAFGDTGMTLINTTENEITIDGLYPAEDYTFYVMPHSESAALETVSVTNAYATTKVMKVQNFNATDVTPVSFNTSWDAMPEGYGVCIRVYKNIPELNGYNINSVINIADEYKDEFEKNIKSYIEDGMPDQLAVEKALKDVREYFSEKYDETFAEIAAAYYDSGNIIHREDKLISDPGELSMAVEKLEPDTLYTLIVKPCKYDGAICNENCCSQLQVRTLSAKVENLRASDIQEEQFTLTWDYFPTKPVSHIMTYKNVPDITGLDIVPAIAEATGMMNDGKTEEEMIASVTEKYGETIGSAISAMQDANNMIPEKNWEVNAEDLTHATLTGLEADTLYTVFIVPEFYDQNVASDNTTVLQVRTKEAVEFYDLWVNGFNGIQVSSDNCQDILGNGKKELVYDPAAKTLSINGDVALEETLYSKIEGLTIDVKKDSTLTLTKDENVPLLLMSGATTITGSGKLKIVNESRICIGYIKDLTIKNASIDMNGDVGFLADADVDLTVINSDITIKVTEFAISTNKLTLEDCYVASPDGEVIEKDGILHDENGNVIKEIVIKSGEKPTTTDSTTATSSTTTTSTVSTTTTTATTTTSGTGKQTTTTTTASTTASTTKATSTTASVTGEQSTTTTASTTASTTKATSTTASVTGEQSTTTTASTTASTTKATSTTASDTDKQSTTTTASTTASTTKATSTTASVTGEQSTTTTASTTASTTKAASTTASVTDEQSTTTTASTTASTTKAASTTASVTGEQSTTTTASTTESTTTTTVYTTSTKESTTASTTTETTEDTTSATTSGTSTTTTTATSTTESGTTASTTETTTATTAYTTSTKESTTASTTTETTEDTTSTTTSGTSTTTTTATTTESGTTASTTESTTTTTVYTTSTKESTTASTTTETTEDTTSATTSGTSTTTTTATTTESGTTASTTESTTTTTVYTTSTKESTTASTTTETTEDTTSATTSDTSTTTTTATTTESGTTASTTASTTATTSAASTESTTTTTTTTTSTVSSTTETSTTESTSDTTTKESSTTATTTTSTTATTTGSTKETSSTASTTESTTGSGTSTSTTASTTETGSTESTTTTSQTTTASTTEEPVSTTTTETTPSQPDDYDLGDVNEDGKVDAKDASIVLVAYAKVSTGSEDGLTEKQRAAADVNADGKVDAKDASSMLAYYAMVSTASGDVPSLKEYMTGKTS